MAQARDGYASQLSKRYRSKLPRVGTAGSVALEPAIAKRDALSVPNGAGECDHTLDVMAVRRRRWSLPKDDCPKVRACAYREKESVARTYGGQHAGSAHIDDDQLTAQPQPEDPAHQR